MCLCVLWLAGRLGGKGKEGDDSAAHKAGSN